MPSAALTKGPHDLRVNRSKRLLLTYVSADDGSGIYQLKSWHALLQHSKHLINLNAPLMCDTFMQPYTIRTTHIKFTANMKTVVT